MDVREVRTLKGEGENPPSLLILSAIDFILLLIFSPNLIDSFNRG